MQIECASNGGICCSTFCNGQALSFDLDSLDYWCEKDGAIRLHVQNQSDEIVLDDDEAWSFRHLFTGPNPHSVTLACVQAGNHFFNLLRISSYVFDRGIVAVFLQSCPDPVLLDPDESRLFVSAMNNRHITILTAMLRTEDCWT